jgi:hypothetical protein
MSSKIWFLVPLGLFACASDRDRESALTPASGAVTELAWNTQVGVSQIAKVVCDREQRCDNVGERGAYTTHPACVEVWTQSARQRAFSCRAGFGPENLNECLQELRETACSVRIRDLQQIDDCEISDLCADTGDRI